MGLGVARGSVSNGEAKSERGSMSECKCVSCGACRGSGQVMVPTIGYPEDDLEPCSECDGTGLTEVCQRCRDLEEIEREKDERRV